MIQEINKKLPVECSDITEVRNEIDVIDKEIIRLLSTRLSYVREVVKFKDGTPEGIEAPNRRNEVLETRRQWAEEDGLDPSVIEDIYNRLIDYFIDEEKKNNK